MSVRTEINNLELNNPLMVAAGVLGTTASSLKRLGKSGAGALVTKSISLEPKSGNKGPVLIETDCGVINSMGLPNPGVNYYKNELKKLKKEKKPIICSIFGETPQKAKKLVMNLEKYVDAFELNLSCPNIDDKIISSDNELIESFVKEVSSNSSKPLWVKLSPSQSNIQKSVKIAESSGADALVLINTLKAMAIDIESGRPILGNKTGGYSGKAIHPIAVEQIYEASNESDIPIIGVGGVSNFEDVVEMIMAGAKAVQIGTALKNDLKLFKKIERNLIQYLEEKNLDNLEEIRGISHKF